jgi:hypothetical protein
MSLSAVVMMVVMLTAFWGGFGALLCLALRRERSGNRGDREGD